MEKVNNEVYHSLGERWYTAKDDPIALLRAESRFRNPWIAAVLSRELERPPRELRVLDIGCGGGFLSNELAARGFSVTGLDQSPESLAIARAHDQTASISYIAGDAGKLPFPDGTFDAVAMMDFLEHVETPAEIIREAARVLRPGGLWFFHTFNRTVASHWIAIRAVERFVSNVPTDLHLHRLFITPEELRQYGINAALSVEELFGMRPALDWTGLVSLARIATSGTVPDAFRFVRTGSLAVGYCGWGRKASRGG